MIQLLADWFLHRIVQTIVQRRIFVSLNLHLDVFVLFSESMKKPEAVHDPEGLSQIATTGELPVAKVTKSDFR